MFVSKYNSYEVADISGQNVYRPGVFFEIIIGALFGKNHYFHQTTNGTIHEYSYLAINSWKQAFTKTQSPFYGCFVYPIAYLLVSIMNGFGGVKNGAGVIGSIFITAFIIRMITLAFSFKSQMNQERMQSLQLKQSEIQAKYKRSPDPAAKQKQQMEIMAMYRKEGISPLSSIGVIFLSFPFLIAMYVVIKSVRQLRVAHIGALYLINRPWSMITSGHYIYLVVLFVYLPLQILSMFLPTILTLRSTKIVTIEQKKARRKQLIIQGVMALVFFFVTVTIAAGVAIYWIFSAFIQILQTLFFHWLRKYRKKIKSKDYVSLRIRAKQWFYKTLPFKGTAPVAVLTNKQHAIPVYRPVKRKKPKKVKALPNKTKKYTLVSHPVKNKNSKLKK